MNEDKNEHEIPLNNNLQNNQPKPQPKPQAPQQPIQQPQPQNINQPKPQQSQIQQPQNQNINQRPQSPTPQQPIQQPIQQPQNINQPKPQQSQIQQPQPQPQNINQPKKKKTSRSKFLIGCFGIGTFLVIISIVLMVLMISSGSGGENTLLKLFGGKRSDLKSILSIIINLIFGTISFIALIILIVGIFRRMLSFQDKNEKKKANLTVILGLIFLIVSISLWIFLYYYIEKMKIEVVNENIILILDETGKKEIPKTGLIAPITITFQVAEKYENANYNWNFGDNDKATGKSYKKTYFKKNGTGKFPIKLLVTRIVKGQEIKEEFRDTIFIENTRPTAKFIADPIKGDPPLSVFFNAKNSKDPDGGNLKYEWDFENDGVFDATGKTTSFEYTKIGKYTAILKVTDGNNTPSQTKKIIVVGTKNLEKPIAMFKNLSGSSGEAPFTIKLDASSSTSENGNIKSYQWSFGDGRKGSALTTKHTYEKDGKYDLVLTITDELNMKSSKKEIINVKPTSHEPKAIISTKPEIKSKERILEIIIPETIIFDARSSMDEDNDIVQYSWDTDNDGIEDDVGEEIEKRFSEENDYKINLTVFDSKGNKSNDSILVKAKKINYKAILKTDKTSGIYPLRIKFDGSESIAKEDDPIVSYAWNFGNNKKVPKRDAIVQYEYKEPGEYKAKLTIITKSGKTFSDEILIIVRSEELSAKFETKINKESDPLNIIFDSSDSKGKITQYEWNFGDGGKSSEINPQHTYLKTGNYTIELTVFDEDGLVDSFSKEIILEN